MSTPNELFARRTELLRELIRVEDEICGNFKTVREGLICPYTALTYRAEELKTDFLHLVDTREKGEWE